MNRITPLPLGQIDSCMVNEIPGVIDCQRDRLNKPARRLQSLLKLRSFGWNP